MLVNNKPQPQMESSQTNNQINKQTNKAAKNKNKATYFVAAAVYASSGQPWRWQLE